MKKIINIIKRFIYIPLWIIVLLMLFGLSFIEWAWVTIKKRKIARKIIYSDLVQTRKEKLTGRPKIIIK